MSRNLILTGGIGHPFEDASEALADILARAGFRSDIFFDIESGIASLAANPYDLLTVYALRWRMLGNEKYAPHRAQWAFSLSSEGRAGVLAHLARGGGLLALHTAAICFDDWREWGKVLGGLWVWGQSFHPPRGPLATTMTSAQSTLTEGLEGFRLIDDEVYSNLDLAEDVVPLMTARAEVATDDLDWPVLWCRESHGGRVAVNLIGHDRKALEHPAHTTILTRLALWCSGRSSDLVPRSVQARTESTQQ